MLWAPSAPLFEVLGVRNSHDAVPDMVMDKEPVWG